MIEQELLNSIKGKKRVYIYGAGMVGSLVLLRMEALGVKGVAIDFVVTKALENQCHMNHKVYSIDNISYEQCLIIVATMPKNQGQILQELNKRNIINYIVVDEELYTDMEQGYISDYISSHKESPKGDRDVLMMSSDNNTTSGAFLCMVDLCRGMIDRGIKLLVVLPGYGNAEQMLIDNNIEYTFVQSRKGLIGNYEDHDNHSINMKAVQEIEKLISRYHIKLVHLNSSHTYVGAVAARNIKVPYIWHIRENISEQGLKFDGEEERYRLINEAEKIITVSNYIGSCYPRLNREKLVCIYDGVDTMRYYYEHEIMSGEVVRILMPGIMVTLKGQHQLVEAAKGLMATGIEFEISLVGSGDADYIKMLENRIDQNRLNDKIHIYGRVNNIEEWYKNSDIVVVCSRSEAFGRVTVEAQLAGCVVIGASCGATPELISDGVTGYLYEIDDVEMLETQILKACRDKKKTIQIARQGQQQALKLYDKSLNCDNVLGEYKKIFGDELCI